MTNLFLTLRSTALLQVHSPKLLGGTSSKLLGLLNGVWQDMTKRLWHADIQQSSNSCKDAKHKRWQRLPDWCLQKQYLFTVL